MLALKINRNNIDSIYNISYVLSKINEYNTALNILKNSSDEVKEDLDISNMIKLIEEKVYE